MGGPISRWIRRLRLQKEIIQENVFTYFNLIFLVLAVLLLPGRFLSRSDLFYL